MQLQSSRQYEFNRFRLDVPKRQLLRDGEPVGLKPKAFDLLLVLVENAGRLLSKEELFERVWGEQIVEESNLTVNMTAIRKALGEKAREPRYITTISGEGYRFIGDVREVCDRAGEFIKAEEFVIESQTLSRVTIEQEEFDSEPSAVASIAAAAHTLPNPAALEIPAANLQRGERKSVSALTLSVVAALCLAALGLGGYFLWRGSASQKREATFTSVKRLTSNGKVSAAALSPDGKLFAYTISEGEQESLWLGHVDGGEPIEIRSPVKMVYLSLRFSPDGNSLYYVQSENFEPGTLYRIPVFGGPPEKIHDDLDGGATFAPDRQQVAFFRGDKERNAMSLIVADIRNGAERTLVPQPADSGFNRLTPAWSPDGTRIAFGLIKRNDDASDEIFIVDATAGGVPTPLTKQHWSGMRALTWQADGRGLIAIARESRSLLWQPWQVSFPDGSARRIVTDLSYYGNSVSVSADDKNLLAIQTQQQSNIWVASADNLGGARQVTFGSFGQDNGWNGLSWMPDGRIIYTKLSGTGITIWTMNADGTNQKQLIPPGGDNLSPSVTSDSRFVVFQSNRSGEPAIWRADVSGENLVQLTHGDIAGQPSLSPDGRWIVYVTSRENTGQLWRVPVEGGAPQRLTEREFSWVGVSPDSTLIAAGYEERGNPKVALLSIEGGEPRQTFDAPRLANFRLGIRWTPDGGAVAYRDWANGIWKQPLSGGPPYRLEGLPPEKLYSYGWSSDGKQFAFARGTASATRSCFSTPNNRIHISD